MSTPTARPWQRVAASGIAAAALPAGQAAGSGPVKMVLDCDTGVDDTLAILYAALHPAVELLGVGSVWGNVDLDTATRNCLHTVALAGRPEVPVARGADRPLLQTDPVYAYHVHGDDGQGNAGSESPLRVSGEPTPEPAHESAAEQMIRIVREHPGEVEIVAVGPLTNVALALGLDPGLPSLVRGVTIMGGAALAPGNVTEVAEANIASDPDAAAAVFNADWPLTMVGLDVTMRTTLDDGHRARLEADGGTLARYVSAILDHYIGYFARVAFGERRSCMHDALAVAVAAGTLVPSLAPLVRAWVSTEGPTRGQTVCDLRGMYMGFPEQDGARCRPVLETDPAFADQVVDLLVAAGDVATGPTDAVGRDVPTDPATQEDPR